MVQETLPGMALGEEDGWLLLYPLPVVVVVVLLEMRG